MNIQHIEELRAELKNCIDPNEREQIAYELSIAECNPVQNALEFKDWAAQQLAEAHNLNLTSVIANREAQYTEPCHEAANALIAHDIAAHCP
jgi:hypothetical protein